jgi:hypothetical protein
MKSLRHPWSTETLEELGDDHRVMQNRVRSETVILLERDDVAREIIAADLVDRLEIFFPQLI